MNRSPGVAHGRRQDGQQFGQLGALRRTEGTEGPLHRGAPGPAPPRSSASTASVTLRGAVDQGMHLSVYTADPDGIEVEIIWRAPDDARSHDDVLTRRPLDVASARERWGGHLATGSAAGAPA